MYSVVDKRVAVETAQTSHGVVGVVTDATRATDYHNSKISGKIFFINQVNVGRDPSLFF